MSYYIDKSAEQPAYMQLYRRLREDILTARLKNGAKLPSKRFMAAETGVSVITVEHAYALLEDEGYIAGRQRSGYYVCFGGAAASAAPRPTALQSIGTAAPEDFPFSALARTMRRVLSDYGERILVRSPNRGCGELRGAISEYLARSRGISISPESIIIGSGAEYLYGLVVQLLGRGRRFALEDPCYKRIRQVYEANGAECELLDMGPDGIRSEALRGCSAGALHVTPYNSFPSGVTASASKRHEYAAWAERRDAYIIEDDYDSEFAAAAKQVETIFSAAPGRVIYINTFTKTLAPSMRMGYMLLPEPLLGEYSRRLDFYSCTVPVYEQLVLAEFINSGSFERCINRRRRKIRAQRPESPD